MTKKNRLEDILDCIAENGVDNAKRIYSVTPQEWQRIIRTEGFAEEARKKQSVAHDLLVIDLSVAARTAVGTLTAKLHDSTRSTQACIVAADILISSIVKLLATIKANKEPSDSAISINILPWKEST